MRVTANGSLQGRSTFKNTVFSADFVGVGVGARTRLDRALAVTLVAGLALLVVVGVVFSIAYSSRQITTTATALHKADETLRLATVARAQLAIGVYLTVVEEELGLDTDDAIALSVGEAQAALQDMQRGFDGLAEDGIEPSAALLRTHQSFTETGESVLDLMARRNAPAALELTRSELAPQFEILSSSLESLRDELAARVASSDLLLGRIGNIARFLVAFLVPAAVMFLYRELLRRQQRQVELERRLETERNLSRAREEFIANASHELRTPLTGITGLALMLAEDPIIEQSESARELLDLVVSESYDLARMVEDLLTAARIDAGALHFTFENVKILDEAHESAGAMQKSGASIEIDCDRATVRADRLRLRQVLRNLLSNSIKYGGRSIRIVGRVEGRTYVCSVVDDGPGIPEEVAGRLFERFVHQGKDTAVRESVGLGLAIVHALANGMGGSITYQRTAGETHFILRLPLVFPATPIDDAEPQLPASRSDGGTSPTPEG